MIDYSKFGRSYFLAVQTQNGEILQIKPPFTMDFDIQSNIWSSMNVSSIRVYNLSAVNRNQIRKNVIDYGDLRIISLQAGYGTNLPEIFNGNITQAWSVREGVNFITQIESFDGAFAYSNGITDQSFPSGTPQKTILESIVKNMPGVSLGVIGNSFNGSIPRGNTYSGNSCALAAELSNGQFFISNSKANFLADNECLRGQIQLITSETGLLGTPLREQNIITFDMIFEPRIVTGQIIELQSNSNENFNGQYKVVGLKHRGTISETICGEAITTLRLDNSAGALNVVGVI